IRARRRRAEIPAARRPRGFAVISVRSVLALLADARLLAAQIAQVVEFGTAHIAAADQFDAVDHGAVHGEDALDAHLEADLADREGLAHPGPLTADDDPLEHLDTGAVALGDVDMHLHGVARGELGDVGTERGRID